MRIYIIPKEYVEASKIRGGEFDGWWELPEKSGNRDYSVASGYVNGEWYQHIYHTAHVSLSPPAARRIRAALEQGDSLVYVGGPQHATNYILWEQRGADGCPHCGCGIVARIENPVAA